MRMSEVNDCHYLVLNERSRVCMLNGTLKRIVHLSYAVSTYKLKQWVQLTFNWDNIESL